MQQLQTIFWQRNSDITAMKDPQKLTKKKDFQQRERNRIQRQNWIIKIIKTIKVLTAENKKNIYESVIRMMTYYKKQINVPQDVDFERNFTEELINLFINFYSQFGFGDTSGIKKIVRPNNTFITIDLLKQLVQTHRQYFKVKILENYKQAPKLTQQRSRIKLAPLIQSRRQLPNTQPSDVEESRKQVEQILVFDKVRQAIFQKWQNYLNYNLPNQKILKQKINDTYLQLLQRNSQNNFMINKFQERCHGKSRAFTYNISSLYTQQQIKNMQNKLKYDLKQKFANIKQLTGNPSAEQLKQYFKIKVQIQDNCDKIESKKLNNICINSWIPLIVQKSGYQHNPLNLYISFSKELVQIQSFQETCGISMKNYLKMVLKNMIEQSRKDKQPIEIKNFKRHHFLDLNHAKKKQLMIDQHRVYQKSKKQSIFPILKSNQLRQQSQIALKNRSVSQYKLAPIFKNQAISKKLQIQNSTTLQTNKSMQVFKPQSQIKIFPKKQDKDKDKQKWIQRIQSVKTRRLKIDNIIDKIISQRNMTISN